MNTRSRKSMGLSHRMIALLLCCVCLFAAMPVSAIAAETENTQTESPVEVTETATATPSAEPGETGSEEGEEMASNIEDTGKTENGEVTPAPTETTAPAETEEPVDPVKALYDSLMACKTAEEVSAILSPETEEEQATVEALIAQFTEEQNAALTEKMEELGVYDTDILDYNDKITVTDTIEEDGCLTVTYPKDTDDNKYTFTWEKKDGSNWVKVERKKVTGDDYNISEDGRSINVALDGGAQQTYRAKVATINGSPVTSSKNSNETKVDYYASLQNGSFERPDFNESGNSEHFYNEGTAGLVWKTTDTDKQIEFVIPGNNESNAIYWHGVPYAYDGDQCAEINANSTSALYQDVLTVPGSDMYWSLAHLGRSMNSKQIQGTDTMYVLIMSAEEAEGITTQADVQKVLNDPSAYPSAKVTTISYTWKWTKTTSGSSGGGNGNGNGNGGDWWEFLGGGGNNGTTTYTMSRLDGDDYTEIFKYSGDISSSSKGDFEVLANPWKVSSGSYKVPENQYLTRYFFVAGSTANNNATVGNHIDNVWFSTELPPANPGSISLTIQKTIDVDGWDEMTDEQKTAFKKSISFTTNLTGYAEISGSDMTWNENVGTYNIQNYSIGTGASKEVTVEETTTSVDGYQLTSDRTSWTETINEGGVGKAEFTNKYTPSTVKLTIKKQISGNMLGKNDEFSFTVSGGSVADDDKTFTLKAGESKTITVNKGDEVTVTEGTGNYETTYKIDDGEEQKSNAATVTVTEDTTILFTNTKEVTIDTGVILDTLPYVLILAVVIVGAVVLVKKRRIREDD